MRFYTFHLMPWPYLPADFGQTHDTAWVVCENDLYDPQLGHALYNRYLDELEYADELGFDGICVNEHHQNAYGLMPSPNIMAADEFALTPPMLRPLLFAEPEGALALETAPDVETPERLEPALHARVAAARLAWQFPYDRKLRGRLGRATLPALVIWGERDRLVPVAHGEAYAAGLPNARLVTLPGAGHFPYLEAPETFTHEVVTFAGSGS